MFHSSNGLANAVASVCADLAQGGARQREYFPVRAENLPGMATE